MSLFCIAFVFKETLVKKPESFSWARANPLGSVCLLFSHGILVRFALMIAFVDVSAVLVPCAFSFEAKKRFAQNANGSSWTLGTLYYTKLAGFEEIQNGVVTTVASAALAGGLLTLLPLAHKCLSVKVIIILSVASSSFALFANGMLAWPMIKHWPGVTVWPYFCAVFQLGLALWFPLMRATAATLFGPSRFAVSSPSSPSCPSHALCPDPCFACASFAS